MRAARSEGDTMTKMHLELAGVGMVTALGGTTHETIAALDRGERRLTQTGLVDLRGDRMVGSFALPVRDALTGPERAALVVFPALAECLAPVPTTRGPTALFLCTPPPWGSFAADFGPLLGCVRDDWPAVARGLAGEAESRGARIPAELRFVIARGHAAGALALEQAATLFERGHAEQALIVGLDTHGDRATLLRLDLAGVLGSRRSRGGFFPGEAAAVLCVRVATENARGARVCSVGVGEETEQPSTARGLTSAVSQSLASWGGAAHLIATVAIDLNGERERAKEWTLTATRMLWSHRATPLLVHPASQLGDVGAACVPLLVGLLARGGGRRGPALAVASSRDGLRGGVVVDGRV